MAFNTSNIISRRKSKVTTNPDSFLNELPTLTISPKKEKGTNGAILNARAMDLLGAYQFVNGNLQDRLIVLPYMFEDNKEDLAIDVTHEPVIKAGKNFHAYKINQNTRSVTSNATYNTIVEQFNLDVAVATTFILEGKEGTFVMTPYVAASNHFNEGEDVMLSISEHKGSDFDIDTNRASDLEPELEAAKGSDFDI